MKTKVIFLLGLFIFANLIVNVNAGFFSDDITFSVNQSEYYFKVGENAIIPLELDNEYGKVIEGTLIYSNYQDGGNAASSNSQSISFNVRDGESIEELNLGTSNSALSLNVNFVFKFVEDGPKIIELEELKIHFVDEETEKQNEQDKQSSTSEKDRQQEQQNKKQQEQQGQQQNGQQPSTQQKMQNNQMGQDSNAIKKQMQRQYEEQEQMKKDFEKKLAENPDFQKEHNDLINEGYKPVSGSLDPTSEDSGEFNLDYKKEDGSSAQLKGEMEKGEMKNMQKITQEDKDSIMKKLEENKKFSKLDKKLNDKGFERGNVEFKMDENKTNVRVTYNETNSSAIIKAEVVNGTIENVVLEGEAGRKSYLWVVFLIILIGLGYFVYVKKFKLGNKIGEGMEEIVAKSKPFNYKKEARKLLSESEKLFELEKFKDAYERAGQSIRLYLGHKNNLKKELTNDEIISFLRESGEGVDKIKECFDLCCLVEFAKYRANKKDFDKIVKFAKEILF